jgi:hypothetical protein
VLIVDVFPGLSVEWKQKMKVLIVECRKSPGAPTYLLCSSIYCLQRSYSLTQTSIPPCVLRRVKHQTQTPRSATFQIPGYITPFRVNFEATETTNASAWEACQGVQKCKVKLAELLIHRLDIHVMMITCRVYIYDPAAGYGPGILSPLPRYLAI